MKELSLEQKAKRYDEAIERAKKVLLDCTPEEQKVVEYISPELKESKESEDERMAKFIKNQLFNIKKTITENYELDAKLTKAIDWFEKQGWQKCWDSVKPVSEEDKLYLMPDEQKPAETEKGVKRNDREIPFSEKEPYEGLTDFERTLADICIGWIGEELGWKQYVKDNADVLLKIAIKKFNSVQDAIFEKKPAELSQSEVTKTSDQVQKPAEWSDEDEGMLNSIIATCELAAEQDRCSAPAKHLLKMQVDWLNFLKDRVQPPKHETIRLGC